MNEKIPGCPLFKDDDDVSHLKGEDIPLDKHKSPLKEIWDWYKNSKVRPYIKVRDLNHGDGGTPHPAAEVGIRISF